MKQIPLTQGKFALVDDADFEWLNRFKWYAFKGGQTFYAVHRGEYMHRLILGLQPGDKKQTDHRDGNGLNNRRANPNRYIARIGVNYKHLYLGCYPTPEAAAKAYDAAGTVRGVDS